MDEYREYTFEGYIQTMTFFLEGEAKGIGRNEEEARENALNKICRVHRLGRNCVRLGKCIGVR